MKKILIVLLAFCLMLCSCGKEEFEEGKDSTIVTEVIKGSFGEQYIKEPLKMFNIGGELYFDSGLEGKNIPRCGTLDGNLDFSVPPGEIPQNDREANFDVDGYQSITSISKEVNIDGRWMVFRKFENQPENIKEYKYCFYIKGRLNNAAVEHEIVVLTDDKDITFSDVYDPLFSSTYPANERKAVFRDRLNTDEWGISLSAEDVTSEGMMLNICQFGGEYKGELNTGAWFSLEVSEGDIWTKVPENPLIDYVWDDVAYIIKKNDITSLPIEWKWLYGELEPGLYRLSKKIMNFKGTGDFEEEIYQVYFEVTERE